MSVEAEVLLVTILAQDNIAAKLESGATQILDNHSTAQGPPISTITDCVCGEFLFGGIRS